MGHKTARIIIAATMALGMGSCIGWEGTVTDSVSVPVVGGYYPSYNGFYNPVWGVGSGYYPIYTPPAPPLLPNRPIYVPVPPERPVVRPGTNIVPSQRPGPANRPGNNGYPTVTGTPLSETPRGRR